MIRCLAFSFLFLFFPGSEAATSGGKGKALGSVADSPRGSSGGGGGARRYNDPRKAPPLDAARKVSEQDCTKPVDLEAGNLRCK
jgi:hypothetical protein